MVEQEAVNFEVTGSSPVVGAIKIVRPFGLAFFISPTLGARTRSFVKQKLVRRSAVQKRKHRRYFLFKQAEEAKGRPSRRFFIWIRAMALEPDLLCSKSGIAFGSSAHSLC